MQHTEIWKFLSKNLLEEETSKEKEFFLKWLNESEENKEYFEKVKIHFNRLAVLNEQSFKVKAKAHFSEKFSFPRIRKFILEQALGNFTGFVVGMWVVSIFSHTVLEKRSINNLFGIAGRKTVVVNEIPHWTQTGISILIGFIVLELINLFFQTKQHLILWKFIVKKMKN